jgi:general secretion pathway protein D
MQIKQHSTLIKTIHSWMAWIVITAHLTSCATYPWPTREKSGSPEQRVEEAATQLNKDTENTNHRKTLRVEKESAVNEMLKLADQARISGNYEQAIVYYDRLLQLDPANGQVDLLKLAVIKEKNIANKMIDARNMLQQKQYSIASELVREILIEKPDSIESNKLYSEINEESKQNKIKVPRLKPASDKPITLELRDANIKVVFEALARATGINFILDKDIKPDTKTSIFIRKMSVEDAIDMILASNGLGKKTLSENSALVFPNTQAKIKDYQDLTIRSFYLTNTSAKQVAAMLKTMLKTKDIFIDDRLNMIVMRDTPEVVKIAEKLVQANDMADPEVMLDIEVLEVSRSRLQELGITYPNQLSVIGANTGLTLEALRNVTAANIGVRPNPSVNFNKNIGDVNLLSNPRIRVKNNEKAKVLVGDKVPIITTTSTANVGVAENVTYVDVGLKLDVEPRINLDNYVNIKVGLEVSSLGEKTITKNGAEVYTIGTRNANTVLRLKHGETQILAGLILDDERKTSARVPGLGDVPILGRLFGNQTDKKSKTEIVLAITPRILSNINLPIADVSEYWSGTENLILDHPKISLPVSNPSTKSSGDPGLPISANDRGLSQSPLSDNDSIKTPSSTKAGIPQATTNSFNGVNQVNPNQTRNQNPVTSSPENSTINTPVPDNSANPPVNQPLPETVVSPPVSPPVSPSTGNVPPGGIVDDIRRSREILESYRNANNPNSQ